MKYISFNKRIGKYYIIKKIKGKQYYFGIYSSLKDAKKARDYFEEKGWENSIPERFKFTHSHKKATNVVWVNTNNRYEIRKMKNGKLTIYGAFKTFEEAVKEAELLKKVNWDIQALCDLSSDGETITEYKKNKGLI